MSENKQKLPIFIGCAEPKIIQAIDEIIKQNTILGDDVKTSELFDLVVINPAIHQKLEQNYGLMAIDAEQRAQVVKLQANEQERKKAKETSITMQEILTKAILGNKSKVNIVAFNKSQLKHAITTIKGQNISNKDVDGLIEFVSLHNFITPVDLEVKSHFRQWKFVFTPLDMLEATSELQGSLLEKIEILRGQYDLLDGNRVEYEKQIADAIKVDKSLTENSVKCVKCKCETKCETCNGTQPAGELIKVSKTRKSSTKKPKQLLKEEENHNSDEKNNARDKSM